MCFGPHSSPHSHIWPLSQHLKWPNERIVCLNLSISLPEFIWIVSAIQLHLVRANLLQVYLYFMKMSYHNIDL